MDLEELTPGNLYRYLHYVRLAATMEIDKITAAPIGEKSHAQLAMHQGAAMLATEIIKRYGLGPRPADDAHPGEEATAERL